MKKSTLFKKQRELLKKFIHKTSKKTLTDPKILKIITKVYSKKILNRKEIEMLKGNKKKRKK